MLRRIRDSIDMWRQRRSMSPAARKLDDEWRAATKYRSRQIAEKQRADPDLTIEVVAASAGRLEVLASGQRTGRDLVREFRLMFRGDDNCEASFEGDSVRVICTGEGCRERVTATTQRFVADLTGSDANPWNAGTVFDPGTHHVRFIADGQSVSMVEYDPQLIAHVFGLTR